MSIAPGERRDLSARLCGRRLGFDFAALDQVDRGIEDDHVAFLDAIAYFHLPPQVSGATYLLASAVGGWALTLLPSTRSTGGLRTTTSPSLTPSRTSTCVPKSRATDTLRMWASPPSTTAEV